MKLIKKFRKRFHFACCWMRLLRIITCEKVLGKPNGFDSITRFFRECNTNNGNRIVWPLKILIMVAYIVFASSCKDDQPVQEAKPLISIDIDSLASFTNDSIRIDGFVFSPIDSNKIWALCNYGESYELNLADGSWVNLNSRFGPFSFGMHKQNIVKDLRYPNLLWLSSPKAGLIAYNTKQKTYVSFSAITYFLSICFVDSLVAVGTYNGLYLIDRSQNKLVKSKSVSELVIKSIIETEDDNLLINNSIIYNPEKDVVLGVWKEKKRILDYKNVNHTLLVCYPNNKIVIKKGKLVKELEYPNQFFNRILVDDEVVWLPLDNLFYGIIKVDFTKNVVDKIRIGIDMNSYEIYNDKDIIWFFKNNLVLCFHKATQLTDYHELPEKFCNTRIDSKYLYGNTLHGFHVFSKDYLLQQTVPLKNTLSEEKKFRSLADSLAIYDEEDFKQFYKGYKLLLTKYANSTNKNIIQNISNLEFQLRWKVPRKFKKILDLEPYVKDSVQDNKIKLMFYMAAIRNFNYLGKLKYSLRYDSVLKQQFQESRDEYHIKQMDEVEKSYSIIQAINANSLPNDLRLWKLGATYYDLFLHVGPETECSIDMTFPFKFLDSLLKKYPSSEYADDAEFLMISHDELSSHEGGDNSWNLEAIKLYLSFLKKYPQTVFTPVVYHKVAGLYYEGPQDEGDELKLYKSALEYADKVIVAFPDYAKIKDVLELRASIRNSISGLLWGLKIKMNKKEFLPNEPIEVTFRFTNRDTIPQKITVFNDKNLPNFCIIVKKYFYDENNDLRKCLVLDRHMVSFDTQRHDTIIGKNLSFTETFDITRCARDSYYEPHGKFTILEPGRYSVEATASLHFTGSSISSNTVFFRIKAK